MNIRSMIVLFGLLALLVTPRHAYANGILYEIDRMMAKEDPDARAFVRQGNGWSITRLGLALNAYHYKKSKSKKAKSA